jgi:hypothetical protein
MSQLPDVADIYGSYPEITVCRYSSFLDNVHNRDVFGPIYTSLAQSTSYYVFLDTDEFLTLVEDADHHDRHRVVPFIEDHLDAALFPGIWLNNKPGSRTKFDMGGNCGNIRGGLLWGKPITKADTKLFSSIILHNAGAISITSEDVVLNQLAILHTPKLIPARRIRSGVSKLIHHRALPPGATLDDALAIPEDNSLHPHARNILAEIRSLVGNPNAWEDRGDDLSIGMANFGDNGHITHSTTEQRGRFQEILNDGKLFFRTMENEFLKRG